LRESENGGGERAKVLVVVLLHLLVRHMHVDVLTTPSWLIVVVVVVGAFDLFCKQLTPDQ
jgi:hypothetical protein